MSVLSPSRSDQMHAGTACEFKGSAIRGSSLLNTTSDLRALLRKGSTVLINNVSYETSLIGDWTASSIQLTTDYIGETNFNVIIRIPDGSMSPKKKKGADSKPGKATDISSTVQQLDSIQATFAARLQTHTDNEQPLHKGKKSGAPKQRQSKLPPPLPLEGKSISNDSTPLDEGEEYEEYETHDNNQLNRPLQPQPKPRKLPPLGSISEPAPEKTHHVPKASVPSRPRSRTGAPQSNLLAHPEQPSDPRQHGDGARENATGTRKPKAQTNTTNTRPPHRNNSGKGSNSSSHHHHDRGSSAMEETTASAETGGETSSSSPKPSATPLSEEALIEQRRAAAERVKRKLKEDQERAERDIARKEAERQAQHEASLSKARELQARTAARVEQYHEEKLRKAAERKAIEAFEKQQRELVNQEYLNAARHQKMKDIRREAKQRLLQVEQEEYRKAVEAAENLQKQLFERHKKYDVNTTFLPRLDGLPPQHTAGGSGGGGGNGRRGPKDGANPPGRVVKSLASEIEQLEESSAHFPEEPVLRSRSAKQAVRFKAGPAATKASGGGGGGASAGVAAPQVLSARRADSLPAVGIKYQQQQQPPALRPRDEDEWSDDEPDPFLQAKQHLLHAKQQQQRGAANDEEQEGEGEYLEEDSLMHDDQPPRRAGVGVHSQQYLNDDHDDYGRLDDEMEIELFGKVQRSPEVTRNVNAKGQPSAPMPGRKANPTVLPVAKPAAVRKGSGRGRVAIDDAASDCSELTTDSMQRGGRPRGTSASGKTKKSAHPPLPLQQQQAQQQQQPPAGRTPAAPPAHAPGSNSASNQPRPMGSMGQQAPAYGAGAMGSNYNNNSGSQYVLPQPAAFPLQPGADPATLQQVQFASSFAMVPVPAVSATKQQQQQYGAGGSGASPSPTRSKGKPVYRKLKPIPVSQPYHPVPVPVGVHGV